MGHLRELIDAGDSLWIDCGLGDEQRAAALADFAATHPKVTGIVAARNRFPARRCSPGCRGSAGPKD